MKDYLRGQEQLSLDEHHVIPREHGGLTGPTVHLTPSDHQTLHRARTNLELRDRWLSSLSPEGRRKAVFLLKSLEHNMGEREQHTISFTVDNLTYKRLQLISENYGVSVPQLVKKFVAKL